MNQSHRNLMQEIRLDQAGCQHTLPELNSAISASTQQNPALTRDDASRLSRNFSEEFPLIQPRPSLLPHRITAFPQGRHESYPLLLQTHRDPQHIWSCAKSASTLTVHRHHGHGISQCHDQTDDGSRLHIHRLCLEYVETVVP